MPAADPPAPRGRVLVVPDKFKGTATAQQVVDAVLAVAAQLGRKSAGIALSDGGDGLLDVLGGPNCTSSVTGPLGAPVPAPWRLSGHRAVIESALACGLLLAGGMQGNDPLAATSRGVGELIELAVRQGAEEVLLGLGGTACTDGGLGALAALSPATLQALRTGPVTLSLCCDVDTRYCDAARVFAPQKGADAAQVIALSDRLLQARATLLERFGLDVAPLAGGGAAGGLGGALAAAGGVLRPGFALVAEHLRLADAVRDAALVITGEGRLDVTSFRGKVVGGVLGLASAAGVPAVVIAGSVQAGSVQARDVPAGVRVVSLTDRFGADAARGDVLGCVRHVAREVLG